MIRMMGLQEIQEFTGGQLHGEDVRFNTVSIDTRTLQPGDLFIAISGERFNGNDFVQSAADKQAVAAITSENLEQSLTVFPTLQVDDTRLALGQLGAKNRELSTAKVIALTGSQGKTTVKEMTASILQQCGTVLKTQGNLNNDYGAPLTLLKLEAEHQFAVIELGANAPGEIAYTSMLARPDVAHITNIAATHLEGFGDMDGVAKAKGEIWESLADDGIAVLNIDDAYGSQWLEKLKGKSIVSISALGKAFANYKVADLQFDEAMYSAFVLHTPAGSLPIKLPLPGQHNVANALAAAALSMQVGASLDEVQLGLENMQSVAGRMNVLTGPKHSVLIDDSYNASPSSFRAAIDVLAEHQGTTVIAMGDMGELGADAEQAHAEVGAYARQKNINYLFGIGNLTEQAVAAFAKKGVGKGSMYKNFGDLASSLGPLLSEQTKVLIKGSRSAGMDKLVQLLQPEGD